MIRRLRPVALLLLGLLAGPVAALAPPERVLTDRMRSAGLESVEPLAGPTTMAGGRLPGVGAQTVLLFAGCGPGAEASRDAALVAVADLARTPRQHTLEVVVCAGGGAGEETANRAAAWWLQLNPSAKRRQRVLAALHLEPSAATGAGAVGLLQATPGGAGHRLPPAWLAHAAMGGARAAGGRLRIGDLAWPLLGQLVARHAHSRQDTGGGAFLEVGVPALTLAGQAGDRSPGWPPILAGIVRRLDALAGRPRDDDAYLAAVGRVWSRRDLYWAGLAVFVTLVVVGLPGAWRGADSDLRRWRGRRYLPGFALRMLFLAVLLLTPASALLLLAPAALLTLWPLRRSAARRFGRLLAGAPLLLFTGHWLLAALAGRVSGWPAQPARLALLVAGVLLAVRLVGDRGEEPS